MKIIFLLVLSLLTSPLLAKSKSSAVTYDLGGGRFGDQCLGYLHAKWISYYYDIPLLYRPFIYSDELRLHKEEKQLQDSDYNLYDQKIHPEFGKEVIYDWNCSALYIIPYFPEAQWEHTPENRWYFFPVNWKDPEYKKQITKLLKPINFKPRIKFPKDRIPVAVHVRLGGGYDDEGTKRNAPLKLPPLRFYKEEIRHMAQLLKNKPLYVHVFTDDPNPQNIVNLFKKYTADLDITYGCRTDKNTHTTHVLEDFFEMTRFQCLIRPESNYSIVAAKIGDFDIIISPLHFTWITEKKGYVDEVTVEYRD